MDKESLHTLLQLQINSASPAFIIYSEKTSPRLDHVAKFIFNHVLKVNVSCTNSFDEFQTSRAFKINYSQKNAANAFHILPNKFLFENGVSENKPKPVLQNELVYFFVNEGVSTANLDYDIFAAAFYFISRYEEWQNFEPDAHGRFEAKASVLFQNNSHLKPVVDIWILEFKNKLLSFYKEINFPGTKFKAISTIDVDNLYAYKAKGFLRTLGAFCKDLLRGDLANLKRRMHVLKNKEADPFDIYSSASDLCLQNNIPLIYFFLFRTGNKYDRTVDPTSNAFSEAIERIKKRSAAVGLHPSYYSSQNKNLLQQEIKTFAKASGSPVYLSRQHYLRFDIETTPALLMDNGIIADFTMGFASDIGFRAGTSFPFYYYNLNTEEQKDLLLIPFCGMDGAYFIYDKISPEKMQDSLLNLAKEIKKVNGLFVSVFHERTFAYHLYPGYNRIYNNLHQTLSNF